MDTSPKILTRASNFLSTTPGRVVAEGLANADFEIITDPELPADTPVIVELQPPEAFAASWVDDQLHISSAPGQSGGQARLRVGLGATLIDDCAITNPERDTRIRGSADLPLYFGNLSVASVSGRIRLRHVHVRGDLVLNNSPTVVYSNVYAPRTFSGHRSPQRQDGEPGASGH